MRWLSNAEIYVPSGNNRRRTDFVVQIDPCRHLRFHDLLNGRDVVEHAEDLGPLLGLSVDKDQSDGIGGECSNK